MAASQTTLKAKLIKVFLIQIVLISLVTLAGIFAAKATLQDVLVRAALEGEAAHFWQKYNRDADFPLPDTMNLTAYLAEIDALDNLPAPLKTLSSGLHRVDFQSEQPIIYVDEQNGQRLYLVFDEVKVSRLALVFGILPLALVLVVLYLLAWIAYRQSHKAISPIVQLSRAVEQMDFHDGQLPKLELSEIRRIPDEEVSSLVRALDHFTSRLESFVERERNFTRDVSHELRTPIAVIRGALELVERKYGDAGSAEIHRMYRTLYDMESLIETLLLLARDQEYALHIEQINVNDLIARELDNLQIVHKDKPVSIHVEESGLLQVRAPERVLPILIGNLLRNAFNYTLKGSITIRISAEGFVISDSGIGMDKAQLNQVFTPFFRGPDNQVAGHGVGMTIVKRLCNRYDWRLRLSSKIGEGTEVGIEFPKAQRKIN
ncbi:two-component system sensor protein [Methylophaga frappieri]|uniref:histidine kinase n=1 Tax=Methylophaga frappieri (strain ATCC BAA-2434 / DSM 25690 / JAM7) TaxID=754477 RepID=I1YF16_METFJ|nr:HAMP domain-containing sensor histidine kinase [Methylophaga frappieri]AFJ01509.1 two-component system sensor protein [Methylophaga frappieri]